MDEDYERECMRIALAGLGIQGDDAFEFIDWYINTRVDGMSTAEKEADFEYCVAMYMDRRKHGAA